MGEMRQYLYCVIKERESIKFDIIGQKGQKVYTINQDNLALVVSDSEIKEYPFIREHLVSHQEVIEKVMKEGYDVLPVSFGTVANSAKEAQEKILKIRAKELLKIFETIEGKVELGLRALWKDMPKIFKEIIAENIEIQRAKKEAQKNPHQFKIAAVGEMVVKALELKKKRDAEIIMEPLQKLAADFKEREIMGESMIFSSAFLVPKENEKKFDKKIEEFKEEQGERVKFIYVGPIPPYNFVELHISV